MKRSFGTAIFAVGLLVVCSAGSGRAQDHAPAIGPPLGLWVWSVDEVESSLSVSIEMIDGDWRATVDGAAAMTTFDEGVISVTRPDGQNFAGELTNDRSQIRGHWFQPSLPLINYQDVVTPIVLPALANGLWQADMILQSRPFRVFLDVFEGKGGEIFGSSPLC